MTNREVKPTLFLVTEGNYIFGPCTPSRLSNSKGFPTNALYGFTKCS